MISKCNSCGKTEGLKHCARCKQVSYCSPQCQKVDWKAHKSGCRFTVVSPGNSGPAGDALSLLRLLRDPPNTSASKYDAATMVMCKIFNTAEVSMAILSLLPAKDLLRTQFVCRAWYRTIALEEDLQQRLFFSPGPRRLVVAAAEGQRYAMGIQPRNDRQVDHVNMIKKSSGPGSMHFIAQHSAPREEKAALELEKDSIPIILNPFFTKLWPQTQTNMTSIPNLTVPSDNKAASWRRMQLTSTPMLQLDMSLWITKPNGKGTQMRPSTARVESGVTLGHLADLLATIPNKLTMHWISIDGHVFWSRSVDAVVVANPNGNGGNNAPVPGV